MMLAFQGDDTKRLRKRRRGNAMHVTTRFVALSVQFYLLFSCNFQPAGAFSLTEWLGFGSSDPLSGVLDSSPATLTIMEISEMRVRDIKRRLSRHHGYGADELARMLDKKELINALSFEEHKARQKEAEDRRRFAIRRSITVALIVVIITTFWGLFAHVFEVAHVNFVVYTDKKKYEISRCWELRSKKGYLGVFLMFVVDMLSLWLTTSVILSWVMRSKYFFPVPHIPIRPAALLATTTGGAAGGGPLSHYGVNVGPMAVTWTLRFVHGRLEGWTGRALSNAQKWQRKKEKADAKKNETPEEKEARRAARAARKAETAARKAAAEAEEEARYAEWDRMRARAQPAEKGSNPSATQSGSKKAEDETTVSAEEQLDKKKGPTHATVEKSEPERENVPIETSFDDID